MFTLAYLLHFYITTEENPNQSRGAHLEFDRNEALER